MGMDERKLRILQAIIDDYILTAVPGRVRGCALQENTTWDCSSSHHPQ